MIGQEAVRVAEEFNRRVGLTGVIFTKIDGDARGGAALSVRAVTGVPIKFLGSGEKSKPAPSSRSTRTDWRRASWAWVMCCR